MKFQIATGGLIVAVMCVAFIAQDEPDAAEMERIEKTAIREPFSELKSLTDAQRLEIKKIRRDILDQINALRDLEEQRIMAVLTDEQVAELPAIESMIRDREREARRAATQPATRPDDN